MVTESYETGAAIFFLMGYYRILWNWNILRVQTATPPCLLTNSNVFFHSFFLRNFVRKVSVCRILYPRYIGYVCSIRPFWVPGFTFVVYVEGFRSVLSKFQDTCGACLRSLQTVPRDFNMGCSTRYETIKDYVWGKIKWRYAN